jgi:hypothetical protein
MTGRSKGPEPTAAIGVRAHSGWAAYVVLGGKIEQPELRGRGIMALCDSTIDGSKQPFHHAEPMAFSAAKSFIDRCRSSSETLASRAFEDIIATNGGLRGCCILTASGRTLPALRDILASHALIHAAEGEFYRDVVAFAAQRRRIRSERVRERDLALAAERLPGTERTRRELVEKFGKAVGPPWRQDEKLATLAAWFALAMKPSHAAIGTRSR